MCKVPVVLQGALIAMRREVHQAQEMQTFIGAVKDISEGKFGIEPQSRHFVLDTRVFLWVF